MNFDDLFYSMKSRYLSFLRCLAEKIINKMDIQIVCVIFKVAKKIIKVRKGPGDRAKQNFGEQQRTKEKSLQENCQCQREG